MTFVWRAVFLKQQIFHSYISKCLSKFIRIFIYKIRIYTSEEIKFSSVKLRDKHSWNMRLQSNLRFFFSLQASKTFNSILEFYSGSTAVCWKVCIDVHPYWIRFQIFRLFKTFGEKNPEFWVKFGIYTGQIFSAAELSGCPYFYMHTVYDLWLFLGDFSSKAVQKLFKLLLRAAFNFFSQYIPNIEMPRSGHSISSVARTAVIVSLLMPVLYICQAKICFPS